MSLRIPRQLRAACAVIVWATYVLPTAVGLLARLAHGAEHTVALLADLERRAVAMGVAHLHDASEPAPGTSVHAHGGAPHAHDDGVRALLAAADRVDEHADDAGATPPIELSRHLPTDGAAPLLASSPQRAPAAASFAAAPRMPLPPPLPPPRA
jgi:hypothetical protein